MSCSLRPPPHLLCCWGQGPAVQAAFREPWEASTLSRMDRGGCNTTGLSPEAAQDDHGSGEGDEGSAVADCVEGLHRQVVIILEQGTGHAPLGTGHCPPLGPTPGVPDQGLPSCGLNLSPYLPSLHSWPDTCSSLKRVSILNGFRMYWGKRLPARPSINPSIAGLHGRHCPEKVARVEGTSGGTEPEQGE